MNLQNTQRKDYVFISEESMNKKDKSRLTEVEKFCLDAWMSNKNADLAYSLSREKPINATPENLHRLALRWLRSDHVKEYLEERGAVIIAQAETDNQPKNRQKDDIVRELNVLANSCKDAKQRTEILLKLADLQRMKDAPAKDEEPDLIHYYLPLSCKNCSLYQANKKKSGG